MSKFTVGDEVKILKQTIFSNKSINFVGMCGELSYLYKNEPSHVVKFIINNEEIQEFFWEYEIELIEPKETITDKQYGHPMFYELLEQMADLHSRKNHDYAGTKNPLHNLKASERINIDPFIGVMIRLQDKWSRLESFLQSGEFKVKDESVEDTLMDNAVYSLLAIILRREQKKDKE